MKTLLMLKARFISIIPSLRGNRINKRQRQEVQTVILFQISYLCLTYRDARSPLARQKWKRLDRAIQAKRKKRECEGQESLTTTR